MERKIKPLTSSLEMIHGDATSHALLFFFSPSSSSSFQNPLFFSLRPSLACFPKWEEKERKLVFITYFLTSSKFYVWFWCFGWKENEKKWFIMVFLLVSQGWKPNSHQLLPHPYLIISLIQIISRNWISGPNNILSNRTE